MSYGFIKWTLFTVLSLTVPTLFFLVQVVMFFPAVFFAAGVFYMIPKIFVSGHFGETLIFIGIMGVHALVYGLVFYGLAALLAKIISLIPSHAGKALALAMVCFGLAGLTFFPLYGGGGHGLMSWMPLTEMFAEINRDYGGYTVAIVYGATILLPCGIWLARKLRRPTYGG